MKKILCAILTFGFHAIPGTSSLVGALPPLWANYEERKEWLEELENRQCMICKIKL